MKTEGDADHYQSFASRTKDGVIELHIANIAKDGDSLEFTDHNDEMLEDGKKETDVQGGDFFEIGEEEDLSNNRSWSTRCKGEALLLS